MFGETFLDQMEMAHNSARVFLGLSVILICGMDDNFSSILGKKNAPAF